MGYNQTNPPAVTIAARSQPSLGTGRAHPRTHGQYVTVASDGEALKTVASWSSETSTPDGATVPPADRCVLGIGQAGEIPRKVPRTSTTSWSSHVWLGRAPRGGGVQRLVAFGR